MPTRDENSIAPPWAVLRRQLVVSLVCAVLLGTVVAIFAWRDRETEWRRTVEQAGHRLELAFQIITRDLGRVRSDLLLVANLDSVRNLNVEDDNSREVVATEFVRLLQSKNQYQQVRLVDLSGHEVVRVDQREDRITVVPAEQLQDKSSRYYIRDSFSLRNGQIFVSRFDLNQENGIIEVPIVPVIRFVTPVSDQQGRIQFLLVFNYLGQPLLDDLRAISLPGHTYLIREDGHYLLGPTPDSSWGWLLDHSRTLPVDFPAAWSQRFEIGQSCKLTNKGAFAYRDIALQHFGEQDSFFRNTGHWLSIVSHHPPEVLFVSSNRSLNRLVVLFVVSLVPLVLLSRLWAVAAARRQENIRRIIESEKELRSLSERLLSVQEDERKSISREIHDELGQQATAINLDLKMAARESSDRELKSLVGRAIAESEQLLETLHHFATRIRPPEIDDLGLNDAVESLVWEFQNRTGIETRFHSNLGETRLPSTIAINVFRLVQESLNNVLKHAQATRAEVVVEKCSGEGRAWLDLKVSDNGQGAKDIAGDGDAESPRNSQRLGILGMKERVQLLRGIIRIESEPGQGMAVAIRLPLPEVKMDELANKGLVGDDGGDVERDEDVK